MRVNATKTALGVIAALLVFAIAPITMAYAATTVNVSCSSGASGLILAINNANAAGGGTINLASGCTYTITAPNPTQIMIPMIGGATGLPAITSPVTIKGLNTTVSRSLTSTTPFRIFEVVAPGGNLTLQGLTITGGNSTAGGGILDLGSVTLNESDVTGNTATTLGGGGIASLGTLVVNFSQVSDNKAPTAPTMTQKNVGLGGGILSGGGSVSLNHSQVTGNAAAGGGGGIVSSTMGMSGATSTMTLDSSQVNENTAANGPGGGIADESSTVVLNNSDVDSNTSTGGGGVANIGGALTLNFSLVDNNTSTGGGGGIANGNGNGGGTPPPLGTLKLFFSEVDGNTSTGGPMDGAGGIANGGIATITLSRVNGNTAPGSAGGGILNHGTMTITLSQVDNNSAPNDAGLGGGGIANLDFSLATGATAGTSGVLTVNLSQVDNNSASGGMGGGIFDAGATATFSLTDPGAPLALNGTLVTGNSSAAGGGIYATTGSPVTLKFTLIFRNHPDNCEPLGTITGCFA